MNESEWEKLKLTDMPKDLTVLDFMVVGEDGAEYPVMMQDVIIQTIEGNYDVFFRKKPDPLEEAFMKHIQNNYEEAIEEGKLHIVRFDFNAGWNAHANWQKENPRHEG